MRWNEILQEGSDFHCPICDDYLGKESEVFQDGGAYCGQCGWESRESRKKTSRRRYESVEHIVTRLQVFGHDIPSWADPEDRDHAAQFENEPYYAPLQVYYDDGEFYVWWHTEHNEIFKTPEEVEAYLHKHQYTKFIGVDELILYDPTN